MKIKVTKTIDERLKAGDTLHLPDDCIKVVESNYLDEVRILRDLVRQLTKRIDTLMRKS
jgi:hypothetical protein